MAYVGDLLGKPYQEGGRGNPGYDCYGLMLEVEKRFGNIMPDFDYKDVDIHNLMKQVSELDSGRRMEKINYYEKGAMIVFRNSFGFATHVGIYMGNGSIIHATYEGVEMISLTQKEDKIVGVYKWLK